MAAIFVEMEEMPVPLTVCPRCGRQVRLNGHCDCEEIFLDAIPEKLEK
jgi:hypothetical protein